MTQRKKPRKNPAALAMVRARMLALSPQRRSAIARNAANVRWENERAAKAGQPVARP